MTKRLLRDFAQVAETVLVGSTPTMPTLLNVVFHFVEHPLPFARTAEGTARPQTPRTFPWGVCSLSFADGCHGVRLPSLALTELIVM